MICHPIRDRSPREWRRGNAAKVILISLTAVFGLLFLACAGLGIAGYFWFQKNFARAMVTDPAVIRTILDDVAELTIPPEFAPFHASQIFGMTFVSYRWCPEGGCPTMDVELDEEADDEELPTLGVLTISYFADDLSGEQVVEDEVPLDDTDPELDFSDESLSYRFESFQKETQEVTIRGTEYTWYIVSGPEKSWDDAAMEEDDGVDSSSTTDVDPANEPGAIPVSSNDPPADATLTSNSSELSPENLAEVVIPGRRIVIAGGSFPGRNGKFQLRFEIAEPEFQREKFQELIESIR